MGADCHACSADFGLETLKNGALLEEKSLTGQPFFTFGRSPAADVLLEHPTASRLHAGTRCLGPAAAVIVSSIPVLCQSWTELSLVLAMTMTIID